MKVSYSLDLGGKSTFLPSPCCPCWVWGDGDAQPKGGGCRAGREDVGTKREGRRREKASFSMPGGGEGRSEGSSSLRASGSWNRGAFHAAGCGKTSESGAQSSPCSRNDVALGCWYRGHIPGAQTGIKPPREWLIPPGIAPEPRAGEGIRGKGCSQRCCKFNCVLKNNQLWAGEAARAWLSAGHSWQELPLARTRLGKALPSLFWECWGSP